MGQVISAVPGCQKRKAHIEMDMSKMLGAQDWIKWFIGISERELISERREAVFDGSSFVNLSTGQKWQAGKFERKTIQEREDTGKMKVEGEMVERVPLLRVIDGCDIGDLQAKLKTEHRAMVQIASNFNCLENPSRGCLPDYGSLVEKYCVDSTQGPAASFGVPAASLLRAHYAFFDSSKPASSWGQTKDQQVDLLRRVQHYFGTCVNGKATLTGAEEQLPDEKIDEVFEQIEVGIHSDAEVIFGRGPSWDRAVNILDEKPLVDQVLSASVNWNSPCLSRAEVVDETKLLPLTRAALRAAYRGAYLAAIARGRHLLLLTLIGGGVFSNPHDMILEELALAHARYAQHHASELREVRLCLYPKGTAAPIEKKLKQLLADLGYAPA
eukprot:g17977.t1